MTTTREGQSFPPELIESMEALSRLVVVDADVAGAVQRIVELAIHAVDGADLCSISLFRGDSITTVAATHELANELDALQYETQEGPCLSSIEEQATFHIRNMAEDETWPTFSKRASEETQVQSMLAHVLNIHEGSRGALNFFAKDVNAFTQEDESTGSVFAAQAGVVLAHALALEASKKEVGQLEQAMQTRQVIGQAVGLVMAARHVDADGAFDILRHISQNTNIKLRDLAADVVEKAAEA